MATANDIARQIFIVALGEAFFYGTPAVHTGLPGYMRLNAIPLAVGITLSLFSFGLRELDDSGNRHHQDLCVLLEVVGTCFNLFPIAAILAYLLSSVGFLWIVPLLLYFVWIGLQLFLILYKEHKNGLIIKFLKFPWIGSNDTEGVIDAKSAEDSTDATTSPCHDHVSIAVTYHSAQNSPF